jgi:hypothetical protein
MTTGAYRKNIIAAGIFIALMIFAFYSVPVFAYSTAGSETQSTGAALQMPSLNNINLNWANGFLNNLSGPFQGFLNTIGSYFSSGNPTVNNINKTITNTQIGNTAGWTIGDAFQKFDGWLYGVAGFRMSDFVGMILGVITWALQLARTVINWLLSLFH